MSKIHPQAQRVRAALAKFGVRARVRTETNRKRSGGVVYREYGNASSDLLPVRDDLDLAALAREARGTVYLLTDHKLWWLSSKFAEGGRVCNV